MSDDDDDDVDVVGLWVLMCIGRIGEVRDGMGLKDWIGGVNRRRDDKARSSHGENRQFMVMVTWLVVGLFAWLDLGAVIYKGKYLSNNIDLKASNKDYL